MAGPVDPLAAQAAAGCGVSAPGAAGANELGDWSILKTTEGEFQAVVNSRLSRASTPSRLTSAGRGW
jgi:hypothetical protein